MHIVFIEASTTGPGEKALDYCRDMAYFITLITRKPDMYSEIFTTKVNNLICCETNNLTELKQVVEKLNFKKRIDGITTTADVFLPNAAKLANDLGLVSLNYESVLQVRNKYLMRKNLQVFCPHLNPPFAMVKDYLNAKLNAEKIGYPLIAKPQDANDSWKVTKINNLFELESYMKDSESWGNNDFNQPFTDGVLLEGFIEGNEYSVETVQYKNNDIELIGVTTRTLEGSVEVGASFPVLDKGLKDNLFNSVKEALIKLDIDCGVIHTECRIKDNQVKILEINPRLAGSKIGSHLIELSTGENPLKHVVEIALNQYNKFTLKKNAASAYVSIPMPKSGVFKGIKNLEVLKKMQGVVEIDIVGELGRIYPKIPSSNNDRIIKVVTHANEHVQALQLAENVKNKAKIIVE
ncbi:ATP-grasp domain-containing protein [Bacillus sp. A301a_S52]|jgi:biotin carboxylase|nr:ATP-grasp domain-containing protein [Bacillus sp. A301a_S52]